MTYILYSFQIRIATFNYFLSFAACLLPFEVTFPQRKYSPEITRTRIMAWCDKAERCQMDVRQKLMDWGIPSLERENLIADLISITLINEQRYASAFAHDKSAFNKWGSRKIEQHLKSKGISERNIADALKNIDKSDQDKIIRDLIAKKTQQISGLPAFQKKMKVLRYLMGKGFQMEDIQYPLDQFFENS